MEQKVSSIEAANLLIRRRDYMTVAEVNKLAENEYPHLLVNTGTVSNILRTFVRFSFAQCRVQHDAYPRQHRPEDMNGYIFKVRGRKDLNYDTLCVESATKRVLQKKEMEQLSVCALARELMDMCRRGRMPRSCEPG